MSFLDQLRKQKTKLTGTQTIVTRADGQRYLEQGDHREVIDPCHGFVVDDKPDDIPALITDYLYIGSQDCASDDVVTKHNIKHVLSLGIDVEVNVDHKYVDCLDLPETDIKGVLAASLPYIRGCIEAEQCVLVHCNAGVSRTSMVAIAYLMQYKLMHFPDAYSLVKKHRPAIKPNAGFERQLRNFQPGNVITLDYGPYEKRD